MSTTTSTDARTAHENALWQALTDHPASTTNELANTASVPKTTARKILTGWLADDLVTRAADDDNRTGFRWCIADTTPENGSPTAEPDTHAISVEPAPADDGDAAKPTTSEPATAEPETAAVPDTATTPEQPQTEPAETADAPAATDAEPPAADTDGHAAPEQASVDATPAAQAADPVPVTGVCPTCGQPPKPQPRGTQPGALRGQVEDFLREHPGEEFTPGQIAKELGGKSSGAVYNACFALVGKYVAEHTCERPNKFKLHPSQEAQQAEQEAR